MDGNTAAAHVAYAFTEVAAIFPITPSSVMAELVDDWSANGRENIFGQEVSVLEMQSEGGAAGAVHGSIVTGALTTTFTASQGLLLMIPNMYKIAGEMLPGVIHVSARTLATHALSIFGDHSDVYSCRSTGYAMLCANNPQEVMDLAAVAHLSTIKGSVPFLHFFDGFRTSHEMQKVAAWDYEDLKSMLDVEALEKFRARANLPAHPVLRGSAQNPDIFFQNREALNGTYDALPDIVEGYMNAVNAKLGTDYAPFNYYGPSDAEFVIVAMGSVCNTAEEVVDAINASFETALAAGKLAIQNAGDNPDAVLPADSIDVMRSILMPLQASQSSQNSLTQEQIDKLVHQLQILMKSVQLTGAEINSALDTAASIVKGKVGLVKVRLYRPFDGNRFVAALPQTVKKIAVLDRTKEPGAIGEPLYLDVITALSECNVFGIQVFGGRYGLGSKDTQPEHIAAVYDNLFKVRPQNKFSVGINDDVTHRSLPIDTSFTVNTKAFAAKFWGIGSDGTVGANKNSIKIIGDNTDLNAQAYFQYDSKKSGGVTISHLRFGEDEIKSSYYVTKANFVACHAPSYIERYDIVQDTVPGGTFLLNCPWETDEIASHLPAAAKRYLAKNNIKMYTVDAVHLAQDIGMGGRTNTILQAAFFKISGILPLDVATKAMKDAVVHSYGTKGEKVVNMNMAAIDAGLDKVKEFAIPADWIDATDEQSRDKWLDMSDKKLLNYVNNIMTPANDMRGDSLPVSTFLDTKDGALPQGTAAFERRYVAVEVPAWKPENCIQCNQCSYVCPHASIRSYALNAAEAEYVPTNKQMNGKGCEEYKFAITVSPADCLGCGSCANICPAKEKALVMEPIETQMDKQKEFDAAKHIVTEKELPFAVTTVKGSQFRQPLFEFSGACAGCGETPYAKLITQLFGERMHIANATGCSSIWGGSAPSTPYTVNKEGRGPAWSNSLFEDNAEFGLGMLTASKQRRAKLVKLVEAFIEKQKDHEYKSPAIPALEKWLEVKDEAEASKLASAELVRVLTDATTFDPEERDGFKAHAPEFFEKVWNTTLDRCECETCVEAREILDMSDLFVKPSFWAFGGDGWAYDIGYGGLDHVIASGENINVFVFDTEVYSNTGGQASKATPTGAVAQFAANGKAQKKKDLAAIAMQYGYVYVAQIAMGADYNQTIKAIAEAEAYDGPSLIIAYAPCINHGSRNGMGKSMTTAKTAVEAGYWHLFRYDPLSGEFTLDSKEPTKPYSDYILSEVRYSSLKLTFPDRAERLFAIAESNAKAKYEQLKNK
ncbi:MAG: 2-oxoacid:acceptor oxidoreductase family protein [Oscillospiraceae bacterium]|nr:2-oxoacid:acceptor oxidoreductase family protein [Oscillospiraceae bacterium]